MRQANMTKAQSGEVLAAGAMLAMLLITACAPPASAATGIQASGVWARAAKAGEMKVTRARLCHGHGRRHEQRRLHGAGQR